ncbi:ammonia monooxygenase [Cupriavidus sp. SK-4]|uniref:DUF6527 family protein n=1 Tax=Cupriavidus sp. SK-4 TaxID=574750 RepID=UPI00044D0E5E|nr:DUF6527 family protein [Cupriavidus sp. SK-4]EYS89462.1 ammonia monooxygenase [Cupriavidus sp. SK-4]
MSALSRVLREPSPGLLSFWCPGCGQSHEIQHGAGPGPRWGWNGDVDRPTFTPSVLVRSGHYVQGYDGRGCWCDLNAEMKANGEDPSGFNCEVCHTFVTDGQIQYLGDCTHTLAGQTVPMVGFPEGWGC